MIRPFRAETLRYGHYSVAGEFVYDHPFQWGSKRTGPDLHRVGGIPALLKYLLKHTDLIDGTQLTVTGKTLAENLEDVPELEFASQDVVRPLSNPIKPTGHLTILRGNLAPDTAVAKITGKEGLRFEGHAKVFNR